MIWRAAVEVTSDTGGDPDVIVGALKPPLLAALLEMQSESHWAWMQRWKIVDAVLRGLLHPADGAKCIRESVQVAIKNGRGSGSRVRWSVQLLNGRELNESTWAFE